MSNHDNWQAVIGLEIHVQLNTKTKLFSAAPNHFGDLPNTNISVVCTAQPGALPVLNKEAVKKAIQFGLAVNANISRCSRFDRKSYFYPDSPRNYQITQYEYPIILGGTVSADVEGESTCFAINRAHLEDDAGTLKHFSSFAGVDYNRAGAPLLEIVSEPSIHSAKQAKAYAMAIKAILEYINASSCNMEEGALRFDANISVRKKGEKTLRNKTEIKNMNSFTYLELAIDSEIARQIELYEKHPQEDPAKLLIEGTYRWDSAKKTTVLMRRKEKATDYRYFPEPDLLPIDLTDEEIDKIKRALPELPHARFNRYLQDYKLSPYSASILINEKQLADFFEEALKTCSNANALCNWISVEFFGRLKPLGKTLFSLNILPKHVSELVNLIDQGKITGKIAKKVADEMVEDPKKSPKEIVEKNPDYQPLQDDALIEQYVDQVLLENKQSIEDFNAGKDRAFGFLVGQVMKLCKGKASPKLVNDLLHKKLKNSK